MAKDFEFMNEKEKTEGKTFAGVPLYKLDPDFKKRLSEAEKMSKEEKENYLLITTKMNEEHLKRINNNVQFFFWFTIIGFILGVLIAMITIN